ncbi:MAG: winged helix-turn-helix domain-containing protein [Bacteroidales bacterium]|nr:winged helix-turn-helix domain-containing protein [Bacteroidales bacterium]
MEIDEVNLELPIKTVNATVKLNKTQQKILPILQANRYTTYEEIARQLGIERTTVWRNLDAMKKKGVIQRIGGDKGGEWVIF